MARERKPIGTVNLNEPLEVDGEEIQELIVYAPRVKEIRALGGVAGEEAKTMRLVELCCNLTPSQADDIEGDELAEIFKLLLPFMQKFQAIGMT